MYFITGSTGMLGNYVQTLLKEKNINYYNPSSKELNLKQLEGLPALLDQHKPKIFIHLAAETNVDLCERDPAHAYLINSKAVETIAKECAKRDIKLLYISTSNVFGGIPQLTYNELDIPQSLNYYGKSKYKGEELLKQQTKKFFIIRAGWMMGGGPDLDKKFVGKILQQLAEGTKTITAVADKFGGLTYAKHLAQFILQVIETENYGTIHFTSKTACSRYDVAKKLIAKFGKGVELNPCSSVMFPLSAPRPYSEALNSVVLGTMSDLGNHTWEELLDAYLQEWENVSK